MVQKMNRTIFGEILEGEKKALWMFLNVWSVLFPLNTHSTFLESYWMEHLPGSGPPRKCTKSEDVRHSQQTNQSIDDWS